MSKVSFEAGSIVKRKVCVVITARPSYSRIKTALLAIRSHPDLDLQLVVAGSALLDRYGNALNVIETDGFKVDARVYMILEGENLVTSAKSTGIALFTWPSVVNVFVPLIFMFTPILMLVWLMKKFYKPDNARDWMICLFTGFFVAYIVLTIVGTFMRGQGMHLMWPWDARMIRVD